MRGSITKVSAAAAVLVLCAACRQGPKPAPSIGEAYVGPATLKLRSDIPLQSPTVATAKHGEKVVILGRRRRFLRVRTPGGAEGWTDDRQLLAEDDMAGLRELAVRAAKMPVQGQATSYGDLNVHTQPARTSPSFVQVKENEKMDVLAHVRMPRAEPPRKPLLPPPAPKKAKPGPKKAKKDPKVPPPPMPKPPGPPANWLELSKSELDEDAAAPADEPEEKVEPTDDWSLVRVPAGQSGWVLTRRLTMAIPDEVAQYAEGHRIVSYFSLGTVQDGAETKHIWLWTTINTSGAPYDFDSFRVFVWGMRRHRYETAHIERGLRGYSPVLLREVDFSKGPPAGRYPGFSVCMEKKDGQRYRREYALLGNVVRFAAEGPCEPAPSPITLTNPAAIAPQVAETAPEEPKEGLGQRMKKRVKRWFGK